MDEDQERFLDEAKKVVREQAYFMKKGIDSTNIRDTLKYSCIMLGELRTSLLSPKNYYILYMQVFDELRVLENYFREEFKRGRKMVDLYESVQHAHNVLPRLYLLITVGSVFIQTHEAKSKDILTDLLEMIKSVQHPLRGLFLRYYFLKMCKDKLPDKNNEYEETGGDVHDSVRFILDNLGEMNKLWIRMQGKQEKSKREKERIDLKVTVGENLHRLSSLEGVTIEIYQNVVLPKMLQMIQSSQDAISQEYLIDCIIQAFPDEFHLNTLPKLLSAISGGLHQNIDLKLIYIHLMDRLADFAMDSDKEVDSYNTDLNIFQMFKESIDKIVNERSGNIELRKFLDLEVAFLKFSLRCYPQNSDNVNQILKACVQICQKQACGDLDEDSQKNIVKFLTMPLETMSLTILQMNEYPNLMQYLPFSKRRYVALKICQAVVNLKSCLGNKEIAIELIKFISPLLAKEKDSSEIEKNEFEEEQQNVAKLVHLVRGKTTFETLEILKLFQVKFVQGELIRMKFTLPSLIFVYIKIIKHFQEQEEEEDTIDIKNLLKNIKNLIGLLEKELPELSLKLLLEFVLCVNFYDKSAELDEFTYETMTQILLIYQDEIADSEAKLKALRLITAVLENLHCLSAENYDTLATNVTQYSAKLLKKNDQCLSVLQCTHLFFNKFYRNEQRVFECFKRCLKLAEVCINSNALFISLYISILNKFFYFMSNGCQSIAAEDVNQCIELVKSKFKDLKIEDKDILRFWNSTIDYVREKVKEQKSWAEGIQI